MTTGYGENQLLKRFNEKWGERGHCIRLQQRKGDPVALSDLIAAIDGGPTYSIEVKRITGKRGVNRFQKHYKVRPLNFATDFSISTDVKVEFKHQLERQVRLSRRMGWTPLVFLQIVTPQIRTDEYLLDSLQLYNLMQNQKVPSVISDDFPSMHLGDLYDRLFRARKDVGVRI